MLCAPTVNDEMEDEIAVPLLSITGEPRLLPPSSNCTAPVGVPEPGHAAETVVLASHEKLGAVSPYVVMPLCEISTLVVERSSPPELVSAYRASGRIVVIA